MHVRHVCPTETTILSNAETTKLFHRSLTNNKRLLLSNQNACFLYNTTHTSDWNQWRHHLTSLLSPLHPTTSNLFFLKSLETGCDQLTIVFYFCDDHLWGKTDEGINISFDCCKYLKVWNNVLSLTNGRWGVEVCTAVFMKFSLCVIDVLIQAYISNYRIDIGLCKHILSFIYAIYMFRHRN